MESFASSPLLGSLKRTLKAQNLDRPTEIQALTIPLLLAGRSVVGVSETGSGKTLAYALPVLHLVKTLEADGDPVAVEGHPRALILVPTRELGEQVAKVFKVYTHDTRVRVRSVLGGTSMDVAKRNVAGAFEVLVATPGRLEQFLDRGLVNLSDVRCLVLDECDQMLDQGFRPLVERFAGECPARGQRVLFTATASRPVQVLIEQLFSNAERVESSGHHRTVASLETRNRRVKDGMRFPVLNKILETDSATPTILFANTREQCDKLAALLKEAGYACVVYRGEMDKAERRDNLKAFREGKVKLLVATDVGARGLDMEPVGRVVNYHLPQQMENYLHRVGRTARAGREGVVVNLVTERDEDFIKSLETVEPESPAPKKKTAPASKPKPSPAKRR